MRETSERVPGKNYRDLCGKPLFAWILETLNLSRYIEEVVVNTDSERIARGVESLGARVLWRPESLRGSMVDIRPLIEHDLAKLPGDLFLQTHSTNPLLTTETVDSAIEAFDSQTDRDSLFTVTRHQGRFFDESGGPINHDPFKLERTQDLSPLLEENSCLYLFTRDVFRQYGHRIGGSPMLFPIDPLEAVDIDEEEDFLLAEALMSRRLEGGEASGTGWGS